MSEPYDPTGVHRMHCCAEHGCKYGDEDCPVESGQVPGISPNDCELCETEEAMKCRKCEAMEAEREELLSLVRDLSRITNIHQANTLCGRAKELLARLPGEQEVKS